MKISAPFGIELIVILRALFVSHLHNVQSERWKLIASGSTFDGVILPLEPRLLSPIDVLKLCARSDLEEAIVQITTNGMQGGTFTIQFDLGHPIVFYSDNSSVLNHIRGLIDELCSATCELIEILRAVVEVKTMIPPAGLGSRWDVELFDGTWLGPELTPSAGGYSSDKVLEMAGTIDSVTSFDATFSSFSCRITGDSRNGFAVLAPPSEARDLLLEQLSHCRENLSVKVL